MHDPAKPLFEKLLVANRGEIACRVIRTARRLGIATVAIHSTADKNALHVRMADETHCVGEGPAQYSYLDTEAILDAAERCGANAIHPGYGFLSENALFSQAVAAKGIVFVGPPSEAIRLMGEKKRGASFGERRGCKHAPEQSRWWTGQCRASSLGRTDRLSLDGQTECGWRR